MKKWSHVLSAAILTVGICLGYGQEAQAMVGGRVPKGCFVPGRNAMTCCAEDIRFFGFLCKYDKAKSLKKGEWVKVTAEVRWEQAAVYDGEGVVLYAQSVEPGERPEDPLVYFV